ncbi:MAG: NAD(P)H-hydrate dehydratase [Cyanobacteria bacterium]|nr:NAD(P)H-hydrate dehydratase [Cyanobacteriota bacterium]
MDTLIHNTRKGVVTDATATNPKLIGNLTAIDAEAIEGLGIPGLLLMEAAGRKVADAVLSEILRETDQPPRPSNTVVIVCGPGNNGGDGFVCARLLAQTAATTPENLQADSFLDVVVISTQPLKSYQGDAKINASILAHYPIEYILADLEQEEAFNQILKADIVVDALFGSGLNRPLSGLEKALAAVINEVKASQDTKAESARVLSIDIPSGLDGLSGNPFGDTAVMADRTITLACGKPGLYLYPGRSYAGEITVADIGIPHFLIDQDPSPFRRLDRAVVANLLPQERDPETQKYDYGHLLLIAGSTPMPGAAAMATKAALKSGVGLVTLATTQDVFGSIQLPNAAMRQLLSDSLTLDTIDLEKYDALAVGPGLGRSAEAQALCFSLFEQICDQSLPAVLDADVLYHLSTLKKAPAFHPGVILTPHAGECARLLHISREEVELDPLRWLNECRERFQATVVLKGPATLVSSPLDSQISDIGHQPKMWPRIWINTSGNAGMAKGGSGDVLTGYLAGLLASQDLSPELIACVGVYTHGLAGDLAAKALGQSAMGPEDITDRLSTEIVRRETLRV